MRERERVGDIERERGSARSTVSEVVARGESAGSVEVAPEVEGDQEEPTLPQPSLPTSAYNTQHSDTSTQHTHTTVGVSDVSHLPTSSERSMTEKMEISC